MVDDALRGSEELLNFFVSFNGVIIGQDVVINKYGIVFPFFCLVDHLQDVDHFLAFENRILKINGFKSLAFQNEMVFCVFVDIFELYSLNLNKNLIIFSHLLQNLVINSGFLVVVF